MPPPRPPRALSIPPLEGELVVSDTTFTPTDGGDIAPFGNGLTEYPPLPLPLPVPLFDVADVSGLPVDAVAAAGGGEVEGTGAGAVTDAFGVDDIAVAFVFCLLLTASFALRLALALAAAAAFAVAAFAALCCCSAVGMGSSGAERVRGGTTKFDAATVAAYGLFGVTLLARAAFAGTTCDEVAGESVGDG